MEYHRQRESSYGGLINCFFRTYTPVVSVVFGCNMMHGQTKHVRQNVRHFSPELEAALIQLINAPPKRRQWKKLDGSTGIYHPKW